MLVDFLLSKSAEVEFELEVDYVSISSLFANKILSWDSTV